MRERTDSTEEGERDQATSRPRRTDIESSHSQADSSSGVSTERPHADAEDDLFSTRRTKRSARATRESIVKEQTYLEERVSEHQESVPQSESDREGSMSLRRVRSIPRLKRAKRDKAVSERSSLDATSENRAWN